MLMLRNLPLYTVSALFTLSMVSTPVTALEPNSSRISKIPTGVIEDPMIQTIATPKLKELAQIKDVAIVPIATVANIQLHFTSMGTYANTYDWGQCTWGVASMKGDIPNNWGNANQWIAGAERDGYPVSGTPEVGAVGVTLAGYYGHVVVVTAINGDGTIQITETNYAGNPGVVHVRNVYPNEFQYIYI